MNFVPFQVRMCLQIIVCTTARISPLTFNVRRPPNNRFGIFHSRHVCQQKRLPKSSYAFLPCIPDCAQFVIAKMFLKADGLNQEDVAMNHGNVPLLLAYHTLPRPLLHVSESHATS